jgi:DNA-binding transcriptional ArsR family regulator
MSDRDISTPGEFIDTESRFLDEVDPYFIDPKESHGRVYGEGWDETKREMVRERDGYECRACGLSNDKALLNYSAKLHVHHIIPAKIIFDPEVRNSTSNLISLCPACHVRTERRDEYLPEGVDSPEGFGWVCDNVENQYKNVQGDHQNQFHANHVPSWYHVPVEVGGQTVAVGVLAEVEYLRRQYGGEYASLMACMGDETRSKIVKCLVRQGTATYDEINEWTPTARRTVKNHVYQLEEDEIVEIIDGRPVLVSFLNDDLRLLASDVLSFL